MKVKYAYFEKRENSYYFPNFLVFLLKEFLKASPVRMKIYGINHEKSIMREPTVTCLYYSKTASMTTITIKHEDNNEEMISFNRIESLSFINDDATEVALYSKKFSFLWDYVCKNNRKKFWEPYNFDLKKFFNTLYFYHNLNLWGGTFNCSQDFGEEMMGLIRSIIRKVSNGCFDFIWEAEHYQMRDENKGENLYKCIIVNTNENRICELVEDDSLILTPSMDQLNFINANNAVDIYNHLHKVFHEQTKDG